MTSGISKDRIVEGVYSPKDEGKYNPTPALNHLSGRLGNMGLESRVKGERVIAKDSSLKTNVSAYFYPPENGNSEGKAWMKYTISSTGKGKKTSKRMIEIRDSLCRYDGPFANKR